MAISYPNLARPVKNATIPFSITPATQLGTATETASAYWLPITTPSINPPPIEVQDCTTTNGSTTVTATAGAFSNIKADNPVTGTGIAALTTVASVSEDGASLELSDAATADGTVTLSFDPEAVSATVLALKITPNTSPGSSGVNYQFTVYTYDGKNGGAAGTEANAAKSSILGSVTVDFDAFWTNLQIYRTQSAT